MTEQEKEIVARVHAANFRLLDELDRVCKKHDIQYFLAYGSLLGAVRHGDFIPWDDDVDVIMFPDEYRKLCAVRHELQEPFQLVQPEDYGTQSYDLVPRINDTSMILLSEDSATRKFYQSGLRNYAALDIFLLGGMPRGIKGLCHKVRLAFWYGVADTYRNPDRPNQKTGLMKFAQSILHIVGKLTTAEKVRKHCWKNIDRYQTDKTCPIAVVNNTLDTMGKVYSRDDFEPAVPIQLKDRVYMAPHRPHVILKINYGADYMQPPPEDQQHPHSVYK